jgi:hypothetical protein
MKKQEQYFVIGPTGLQFWIVIRTKVLADGFLNFTGGGGYFELPGLPENSAHFSNKIFKQNLNSNLLSSK